MWDNSSNTLYGCLIEYVRDKNNDNYGRPYCFKDLWYCFDASNANQYSFIIGDAIQRDNNFESRANDMWRRDEKCKLDREYKQYQPVLLLYTSACSMFSVYDAIKTKRCSWCRQLKRTLIMMWCRTMSVNFRVLFELAIPSQSDAVAWFFIAIFCYRTG